MDHLEADMVNLKINMDHKECDLGNLKFFLSKAQKVKLAKVKLIWTLRNLILKFIEAFFHSEKPGTSCWNILSIINCNIESNNG